MITLLAAKSRKMIAWTLFFLFYGDLLVSAHQLLRMPSQVYYFQNTHSSVGVPVLNNEPTGNGHADPALENVEFVKDETSSKSRRTPTNNNKLSIGGPGQPEMQGFQSVNSNNLVDLFSGDFSYNIPLIDVGGYPLGLSYKSGVSMDQEASWVGLGWNVNPGTISRNVRGLPDDFDGTEKVTKILNIRKNWTAGISAGGIPEIFGKELKFLSINAGASYNNYTGVGLEVGANIDFTKMTGSKTSKAEDAKVDSTSTSGFKPSLNLSLSSQRGMNLEASIAYKNDKQESENKRGTSLTASYNSRTGLKDLQLISDVAFANTLKKNNNSHTANTSITEISFAKPSYTPSMTVPFSNFGFSLRLKFGTEVFGMHPDISFTGSYSQEYIADDDKVQFYPAYGYMYYQKANNDENALLDFNREKDLTFRTATPHIAIPVYTHDVYTISGEGTGGMFRPYRGDAGFVRDHQVKTKSGSGNIGVDLGAGNIVIVGGNVALNYSTVENKGWLSDNLLKNNLRFGESDTTHECVYFRNPGEQTTNPTDYFDKVGNDDVVRAELSGSRVDAYASSVLDRSDLQKNKGSIYVSSPIVKNKRDKRTQVISYLTAKEAQRFAIDKVIKSYPINHFPIGKCDSIYETIARNDGPDGIKKPNQLSEITVLNADGRRYIYGIPAYDLVKKEVTFAVGKNSDGSTTTGLVTYTPGSENTTSNDKGKDHYFSSETTPGYAHSFLLTSLLSPDYVDITGDGITEDDMGEAIKFNYSRMKWSDGSTDFKWRAPYFRDKATYSQGLKTDGSDDKGNYVYGSKEIWYMNSIESKNMIATFVLNDGSRSDAYEVAGENGGSGSKSLKSLKEINLYSKADLIKNGAKARPIKTVHFAYSYKLCKNNPANLTPNSGKLTLDSLWFTYNNNNRSVKNKYRFQYHSNNPDYDNKSYDRWGNYKSASENPASVPNADYPYVTKNKSLADADAGAWNLTNIVLPSGANMNIQYEADDYAFVQNKRAADMFKIYGMANSSNPADARANLYKPFTFNDYRYVFVSVPEAVSSKEDVRQKYLQDINKIYFQMQVKVPSDAYGGGYERIPFFAEYDDYGVAGSNLIWIKLKEFGKFQTFPTIAALQFLKYNLASKAYIGSDVGESQAYKQVILAIIGMMVQFKDVLIGFNKSKRLEGVCSKFDTSSSFLRLNNPVFTKYGGGLRVKRITINDNWNKMTSGKEATYGQEYNYTLDTTIAGSPMKISSGVASYEPSIGNEENPFYLPIEYTEKVTLAPKEYFASYYPLGESYFPGASVGYSKVTVSSINKKNLKSFNGWESTEYYTTKDFPTITDFSTFNDDSRKKFNLNITIGAGISLHRMTLSQGFKIELNDMNGKIKAQKSFAANDSVNPISYTFNYYKTTWDNDHGLRLSNTVPVMTDPSGYINPNGIINKDIEIISDVREQQSSSYGVNVPFNADAFVIGIYPVAVPSFFPKFSVGDSRFRSFSTMKVIQRYGIIDSVVHYEKGSLVSTKNMVYDAETGEPLITRTQNEFNDPVYAFNYPAHWAYTGMDLAYKNIGAVFAGLNFSAGKIVNKNIDRFLESGDEIAVTQRSPFQPYYGFFSCTAADWLNGFHERKLWVVDINKATEGATTRNLFFVDINGNPYYGQNITIKILRSGKRNVLNNSVGSFTCLKNPVTIINSNQWQIKADSTIAVLNTGASIFKDNWAVDNKLNSVTTCTGTEDPACDSLSALITSFNYHFGNPAVPRIAFNHDGCDTTSWDFSLRPSPLKFKDMFTHAGVVSLPDQFIDTVHSLNCRYILDYRQRCIGNLRGGFTFEARVKAPSVEDVSNIYRDLLFIFSTDRSSTFTIDQITYGHHVDGSFDNGASVHSLNLDLTDWKIFKIVYRDNYFYFYVDNSLVYSTYQPGYINKINGFSTQFNYLKGQVDYISLSDYYGKLVLREDFTLGCGFPYVLAKPRYRCDLNCQTSFTNFFNTHFHTSYTFSQIDSVYRAVCRYFYDPCNDTTFYVSDTCITECKSIFTRRFNPYTEGFWGNWRMNRAYTFYDLRKQSSTSVATDIRRDGEFKKFVPYWYFGADSLTKSNYSKWVWNSESTKFNKKGMELENKDPLGRYNSGVYGYNQTLPVAVAQNAKYRRIAFDGFEDYYFSNDSCGQRCPPPRHFDWSAYVSNLTTSEKHSGKYSLKVASGDSAFMNFNVITKTIDTTKGHILVRGDFITCSRLDSIYATDDKVTTPVFSPVQADSLVVGLWVKESRDCKCDSFVNNTVIIRFFDASKNPVANYFLKATGNIIEGWQRYEENVTVPATATTAKFILKNTSSGGTATDAFFDDIRIHPFNATMKSYVYNATSLRLMAELDDNNYASFYEYDDEGTLVRTKKETQQGIKTITESRSVLLK